MDLMQSVVWLARQYNAPVQRDLLECQHHNRDVSEYPTIVPVESVLWDIDVKWACASSSVISTATVLGERSAAMVSASKTARMIRTVCRARFAWIAVVRQAVISRRTADLEKFARLVVVVSAMLDLSARQLGVKISTSVKMPSVIQQPNAPMLRVHTSVCVHLAWWAIRM